MSTTFFSSRAFLIVVVLSVVWNGLIFTKMAHRPFSGTRSYGVIAQNLIEYGRYSMDGTHPTCSRPPFYPLLLAAIKLISPEHWEFLAKMAQGGMSLLCGMLVFSIAAQLARQQAAGCIAAALYHLHILSLREHYVQRETVLFELLLLSFLAAVCFLRHRRRQLFVCCALLSAALYLTRPTGFIFLGASLFLGGLWAPKGQKIATLALVALIFFAMVLPWLGYYYVAFGQISLSASTTSGINLYKGISPEIQSIYPALDVDLADEHIRQKTLAANLDPSRDEARASAYLSREAVKEIRQNPFLFLKRMPLKLFAFFSPLHSPLGSGRIVPKEGGFYIMDFRFAPGIFELFDALIVCVILLFGGLELLMCQDRHSIDVLVFKCLTFFLFFCMTAIHVITFAETRFRLPLDGSLCVASGLFFLRVRELYGTASTAQRP